MLAPHSTNGRILTFKVFRRCSYPECLTEVVLHRIWEDCNQQMASMSSGTLSAKEVLPVQNKTKQVLQTFPCEKQEFSILYL